MAWLALPVLPPRLRALTRAASGESAGPHRSLSSLLLSLTPFCLSSWLEEDEDPVVARVNRRMQHITGLTVKTAELLQVWRVPGALGRAGVFLDTWAPSQGVQGQALGRPVQETV